MSDEPKSDRPPSPPADPPRQPAPPQDSPKVQPSQAAPEAGAAAPATQAPAKPAAGDPVKPEAAKPEAAKPEAKKPEPKAAPTVTGPTDPAPPADAEVPKFIRALEARLPGAIEQMSFWVGDWTIMVPADRLVEVAGFLRDDSKTLFDYCSDVTATDWPPRPKRFDVIYCLYSTRLRHRIRVKVRVGDDDPVPSMTGMWPAVNWLEREVYDMFGVNFTGHPDRRRILMPDEWQGHPQRKDYPLEGPGELLMESPQDWLRLRSERDEADIE